MKSLNRITAAAAVCVLAGGLLVAQTPVSAPKNKYTPAQDVELGREAAQQVEQQLPLLRDDHVASYASNLGQRLTGAIPETMQHPEFRYTFKVVNVREINAFALPGGPTYFNRGMIEVAGTEGEVAGVVAHELAHVALRHGTAQATKATKYELGTMAGAVLGAIIGGRVGSAVAQTTQFGLGTAFLRFSRDYEKQADILGSQMMARAGYDPRDMANMFKTIEKQGGGRGGPQWMSDHPNPGNRQAYIAKEAEMLRVENAVRDTRAFDQVRARLRGMSPAPTTEEAVKGGAGRGNPRPSDDRRGNPGRSDDRGIARGGTVAAPSSQYTTYDEGGLFRVSVPSNWRELPRDSAVTFAPEGAYGTAQGQSVFTHGMEFGTARNESHDLRTATDELLAGLAQSNPRLSRPSGYSSGKIGGRQGLRAMLTNTSDATGGEERIEVYTTLLADGNLFFALGVAPRDEYNEYQAAFRRVIGSIQFSR